MDKNYVVSRLGQDFKRDVAILRQVVYKEVQMWKRSLFEQNDNMGHTDQMYVNGEVYGLAELTDLDKKFIDEEIKWFIFGEIDDELVQKYAEKVIADLGRGTKMTIPQSNLQADLKAALKDKLTAKASEPVGTDEPF